MNIREILVALSLLVPGALGATACATTQPVVKQSHDSMITARVGRGLIADPDVRGYTIDVDTIAGVVYLRGNVDSRTMKTSAERIARNTDGVQRVVNDLLIAPDRNVGENRKDDEADGDFGIKTRLGRSLTADDDAPRLNIDFDVFDGVVTLSGSVHDAAEATEAVRLAGETEGVIGVKNDLKVE